MKPRHWQHWTHKALDETKNIGKIGHTKHWMKQRHWQHWTHKTLDETKDTGNIGHTKHWMKQRHWQHWAHKTQDETKTLATLDTQNTFVSSSVLCVQCCQCLCFIQCFVCPMLPVSLFHPVFCVPNVASVFVSSHVTKTLATLGTQNTG
jgi:hypothetical protein